MTVRGGFRHPRKVLDISEGRSEGRSEGQGILDLLRAAHGADKKDNRMCTMDGSHPGFTRSIRSTMEAQAHNIRRVRR